ncbi:MAG: DUF58 domain-containing protein, partial [Bifidobacteriaceae bacterium]|nr:DUF58 domain-containing protein [Bifidobacteriaceae bacterium]
MVFTWRFPAALALGVVPVILAPTPATVAVWTLLVVVLAICDVAGAVPPKAFRLARTVAKTPPGDASTPATPTLTSADEPNRGVTAIRLTELAWSVVAVTNPTRRPARLALRDAWTASAGGENEVRRLRVPGGATRRSGGLLRPRRRGEFGADRVTVRSFGPLGMAGRQHSRDVPARLRVLPEFRSRNLLGPRLARLRELDGRPAQVRGQGTEFDSLRDYALGDDVRSIDWRASARAEHVMVRTWRPERSRQVVIVLDTSRWAAGRVGDMTRLDAGIEAALLLGAVAGAAGDRVQLLAADRALRAWTAPVVGTGTLTALANALAMVKPALVEANWKLIAAQLHARVRGRALVVLLTSTDPALVEVGLAPVADGLMRRHAVMVGTIRDPADAARLGARANLDELYQAAAAARRELAVAATEARLRALGA